MSYALVTTIVWSLSPLFRKICPEVSVGCCCCIRRQFAPHSLYAIHSISKTRGRCGARYKGLHIIRRCDYQADDNIRLRLYSTNNKLKHKSPKRVHELSCDSSEREGRMALAGLREAHLEHMFEVKVLPQNGGNANNR